MTDLEIYEKIDQANHIIRLVTCIDQGGIAGDKLAWDGMMQILLNADTLLQDVLTALKVKES